MSPAPAPPPSRPVVLLVDDEPEVRLVLELGLKKHFEVHTAGSASEAEKALAARRFDAIVCDHVMPDEEGLTFLARMQKQFPEVKRILLTGYANTDLLSRSQSEAELAECLSKPVRAADLAAAIRRALGTV